MSEMEHVSEYETLMGDAFAHEGAALAAFRNGEDVEDACFGILSVLISIAKTLRARELREGAAF